VTQAPPNTLVISPSASGDAKLVYSWKETKNGQRAKDIRAERVGGQWTVTVDGQPVPADRFDVKDGTITIRDAQGQTIFTAPVALDTSLDNAPAVRLRTQPSGDVITLNPRLVLPAQASRARLGVTMADADETLIKHLGLEPGQYAIIEYVGPGTAAAQAGLQTGDLVLTINGQKVVGSEGLRNVIRAGSAGDKLSIELIRRGQRQTIEATLSARSPTDDMPEMQSVPGGAALTERQAQLKALQERLGEVGREMGELGRDYAGRAREWAQRQSESVLRFGGPVGPDGKPGELEIFELPASATSRQIDARLTDLETRLKAMEELLKRLDARLSGSPIPPTPPTAPTPPTPPTPPAPPASR
jgi:membrane-associated protease RseP (regulator of RpoE activity)